jgi:hypothetical protein
MKAKILAFIHQLSNYDYILFASLFVLFLLLLILSLLIRKRTVIATILLLLSFTTLFIGPFVGYIQLHQFLYKQTTKLLDYKALQFSPTIVVTGTLRNDSKKDFSTCKLKVNLFKVAHNQILDQIFPFNPFQTMSFEEQNIAQGETREFKLLVEPFVYEGDYDISIATDCRW